jgi:hypothetical protein
MTAPLPPPPDHRRQAPRRGARVGVWAGSGSVHTHEGMLTQYGMRLALERVGDRQAASAAQASIPLATRSETNERPCGPRHMDMRRTTYSCASRSHARETRTRAARAAARLWDMPPRSTPPHIPCDYGLARVAPKDKGRSRARRAFPQNVAPVNFAKTMSEIALKTTFMLPVSVAHVVYV